MDARHTHTHKSCVLPDGAANVCVCDEVTLRRWEPSKKGLETAYHASTDVAMIATKKKSRIE